MLDVSRPVQQNYVSIRLNSSEVDQSTKVSVHHDPVTKVTPLLMRVWLEVVLCGNASHHRATVLSVEFYNITSAHFLAITVTHSDV
jgi:hypothetical protein